MANYWIHKFTTNQMTGLNTNVGYVKLVVNPVDSTIFVGGSTDSFVRSTYSKFYIGGGMAWGYIDTSYTTIKDVVVDSGGNAYFISEGTSGSGSSIKLTVAKFNTTGTLLWYSVLSSGSGMTVGRAKLSNDEQYLYVSQHVRNADPYVNMHAVILNTSNGTQNPVTINTMTGTNVSTRGVDVLSNGNVVLGGHLTGGTGGIVVQVHNSTCTTLLYSKFFSGTYTTNPVSYKLVVDESDNIYIMFTHSSYSKLMLLKLSYTDLSIIYQKVYTIGANTFTPSENGLHYFNNKIYMCGKLNNTNAFLICVNTSDGSVSWAREFFSNTYNAINSVQATSSYLYLAGIDGTNSNLSGADTEGFVIKFFPDGQGIGTYSNNTFIESLPTVVPGAFTSSTPTYSGSSTSSYLLETPSPTLNQYQYFKAYT